MNRGIETHLSKTLLSDRAADFLAGGPADDTTLIRHICEMPAAPPAVAERMAHSLLAERPEQFVRGADGLWRLAHLAAALPPAPEPPAAGPVPTFEEWQRRRAAERATAAEPSTAARPTAAPPAAVPAAPGPDADRPLLDLSYAVVDVETTGGSPQSGHRITEIAVVRVADGEVQEVYETLVNPRRSIPPQIMKLTGITMEMVRDQRDFSSVWGDVVAALRGHVFVAHNVAFDWRFVSAEVQRAAGLELSGSRLCTVRLSRKLLPQLRSRSLGYVANHYAADRFAESYFERAVAEGRHAPTRPWRHSAAGDAVATAHCMLRLFRDAADHGVTTWGQLEGFLGGGSAPAARRRRPSALPAAVRKDGTA
jgi:DNA polymerase-3 subunit epsilon